MGKKKNQGGRPPVIDEEKLRKLEYAFAMGCSDKEACLYADIAPSTLYDYQLAHPAFAERKDQLKETPVLKARTTVFNGLSKVPTAQWLLERRSKDFKPKQETDFTSGGEPLQFIWGKK